MVFQTKSRLICGEYMKKTNNLIAIKVSDIHKSFKIPLSGNTDLKQRIIKFWSNKKGYYEFSPLNGVSFEIKKGEFFGIVGRNGSGKSTLLKTIAGIYTPDKGEVKVSGSLVPFIELGVGFNPELTGQENVYLNGALLGFSRDEMNTMYDDIVEFAELSNFMNERLKNYSSGMQVRLAFSIAIRARGDILLLDEVLAVGDGAFQQKCFDYFGELKQNKKTVVLVTHSMSAVEKFCDRGILIDDGKIIAQGDNFEIAEKYQELFIKERSVKQQKVTNDDKATPESVEGDITLISVSVLQYGRSISNIKSNEPFQLKFEFTAHRNIGDGACGISIVDAFGNVMLATGIGNVHDKQYKIKKGKNTLLFTILENIYTNGSYTVNVAIAKGKQRSEQELLFQRKRVTAFSVYGVVNRPHALAHPRITVEAE